jgi:amino acid adenylation domain-containing protein
MKDFTNGLSPEQRQLLAYMLADEGIELDKQKISPRQNSDQLPLSFAQTRLWFLDRLMPNSAVYNIPAAVSISGSLSVNLLEWSVQQIIRRHEVLRTNFVAKSEQPIQVINDEFTFRLPIIDLQELFEVERQTEVLRLRKEEAQKPFDLTQDLLLRAKLLRLSSEEHILLLTMHHIIADGWSLGVFLQELAALYESTPLPRLPIQYADFTLWQQQWLQGDELKAQLSYWKQQLSGSLPILELPTDKPRPKFQTFSGKKLPIALPKSLSGAISNISQQAGVTLFTTLLTAFNILLYRYTGQQDILVGVPVANRDRNETKDLIGFFVNMLVLRTNLEENPSFSSLLMRVREVVLGAYAHQDLPFEKLVETLKPERHTSHTPLFQVMFALQNTPMPEFQFSGLKLQPLEIDNETAKFDLTFDLTESETGICGWIEYNSDLFADDTIQRMAGHWQTLLTGIVANPEQRLSQLPLLTPSEQHQLLVEWNSTQIDYPKHLCFHQLFETQVKLTPNAIALVCGEKKLTYRQLNNQANKIAHHLQKLGIKPEVCVGVSLERSPLLVAGLLGILKAGGAYVPLDPNYPQQRLAFMLQDAQAPVLLTQSHLLASLSQYSGKIVCLDTEWDNINQENTENVNSNVSPLNLAYVLYTSGSTGQPKGVAIEHRSVVALLNWAKKVFNAEALAGVLASTSICFDLSVFELFVPLSWGGQVILAENALHLLSLPGKNQVTLINTVPSAIAELLRLQGIPSSVHTVNLAGEPLLAKLVQQLYSQTNVQQVFNLYGPSEDTTYSTFTLANPSNITIGRPIANTQVYILDNYLKPVPIGVRGELYIAGEGLARGYFKQQSLTAEKFIHNPFSNNIDSRLYKTGDTARYLPNGDIEYLGRLDHQIKIRGFRIELGEIEAVLSLHPDVLSSTVLIKNDEVLGKRLIAYLVLKQEINISDNELRLHLKQHLPEYMLPGAFVILDTLPLLPNGKVDRGTLAASYLAQVASKETFILPRTAVEKVLAEIWSKILGFERVGIHDNFFELGGHSLLATQVVHQIYTEFQIDLPLLTVFEETTIAGLAKIIESQQSVKQEDKIPKIQARPRQNKNLQELVGQISQLDDTQIQEMLQRKKSH